jgi:lysophospholipase L1-like esterase
MKLFRLLRLALVLLLIAPAGWAAMPVQWVSTWAAAPDSAGPALPAQTIRQIVRTSAGGSQVRVRLSNLFGTAPLTIDKVHIAVRDSGAAIRPGSGHALTFNGAASVTIPTGESVLSDAAGMDVAALQELAVSMVLPAGAGVSTIHGAGMQTAYLAPGADSSALAFPAGTTDDSRYFLTGVEVAAAPGTPAIVVVGDSIADGIGSTPDRNARWPDVLAQLQPAVAVANAGIAGNRILRDGAKPFVGPSTLARFERDALDQPGVRWIVLAHGINDIVASDMLREPAQHASSEQIIEGMRTLVRRAHARGVKVWGATLLPFGGVKAPLVHSVAGEAKRQAVNAWMRASGEFDVVLDADLLMRDPAQPERLRVEFDSGDHLHPNDAGHRAMAEAANVLWKKR